MTFSRSTQRAVSVLALSLVLGACSGDSNAQQPPPASAAAGQAAAAQQVPQVPVTSPALVNALPNFAPLVEKAGPAVVNVDVVSNPQQRQSPGEQGGPGGGDEDDPLGDFFRRFGIPEGRGRGFQFQPQPQRGSGSGFIVTADGYIL